jgi:hypothetical protein
MPTLQERVAERYPSLVFLLRQPEVGRLLTQAVGDPPMSPGVFQSKLMATRWFRSQSESQRRWWVTVASDPGEAKRQRNLYSAELIKSANSLGIKLDSKEVWKYTNAGLSQGIEAGSDRQMANLMAFGLKTGKVGPGAYKTAVGAIRAIGSAQWLRMPPVKETETWAANIALGRKTLDDFEQANRTAAEHRFPHMLQQLRAGATVADVIAPMVEAYAKEMDWDAQGLMAKMHTNPTFAQLTGIKDPKTKQVRLPTEYEAKTMARQRGDWWGTTTGRQEDAAKTLAITQALGVRK